jgi:hypothetical protein
VSTITETQNRWKEHILRRLKSEGIVPVSRSIGSDEESPSITIELGDFEVFINGDEIEFASSGVSRADFYNDKLDEIRFLEKFCDSLIFYVKNPEYRDKPSFGDLKSTYRWLMAKVGVSFAPDLPDKKK